MDAQMRDFAENPDWLLQRVQGDTMQYVFAHISRSTYRDSSFLDHRASPVPTEVKSAGVKAVNQLMDSNSRPANYIFHSAFCCSTLFSNCLQTASDSLVLKEPYVLVQLANVLHQAQKSRNFNLNKWQAILEPGLQLLEKTYPDQQGVIIKPSNSANNLLEDIMELRSSSTVFMYGSVEDFLLSNLKSPEESRHMVPLFLKRLYPLVGYAKELPISEILKLDHLQQCAMLWHAQVYRFSSLAASKGNARICCLAANDFLHNPESTVSKVLDFFGLACNRERLQQLTTDGPLSRHSKSGRRYDPETRSEENTALRTKHADILKSTHRWMDGMLNRFPVEQPLQPGI